MTIRTLVIRGLAVAILATGVAHALPIELKDSNGTKYRVNTQVVPLSSFSNASGALTNATFVKPVTVTSYYIGFTPFFGFLTTYNDEFFQIEVRASYYYSFVAYTLFAIGIVFNLPIFILALVRLGVLTSGALRRNRRIGIALVVIGAALLPTVDRRGRVAALEILLPDDAVRNLIRQAKVEQIYSVMQTNTGRGMQTLEQALVDLVTRGVITKEVALSRSSRPDQLLGLMQRSGLAAPDATTGLRVAGR